MGLAGKDQRVAVQAVHCLHLQKLQRVVPSVSGEGRVLVLFERRVQMRSVLPSEGKVRSWDLLLARFIIFHIPAGLV